MNTLNRLFKKIRSFKEIKFKVIKSLLYLTPLEFLN